MARFTMAICTWWLGMVGMADAQPPGAMDAARSVKPPLVETVAAPPKYVEILPKNPEILPPVAPAASPGEAQITREARAHEQYLLQSQAQAESVHRAAVARAEQRTRRLESQRWFGIFNTRPTASPDPYNGDYSPGWASNTPFFPFRWAGNGGPWGFVEGE